MSSARKMSKRPGGIGPCSADRVVDREDEARLACARLVRPCTLLMPLNSVIRAPRPASTELHRLLRRRPGNGSPPAPGAGSALGGSPVTWNPSSVTETSMPPIVIPTTSTSPLDDAAPPMLVVREMLRICSTLMNPAEQRDALELHDRRRGRRRSSVTTDVRRRRDVLDLDERGTWTSATGRHRRRDPAQPIRAHRRDRRRTGDDLAVVLVRLGLHGPLRDQSEPSSGCPNADAEHRAEVGRRRAGPHEGRASEGVAAGLHARRSTGRTSPRTGRRPSRAARAGTAGRRTPIRWRCAS